MAFSSVPTTGSTSPWLLVVLGVVVSAAGGIVLAVTSGDSDGAKFIGLAAVGIGGLLSTVGTVAVGVVLGLDRRAYLEKNR